MPPAPLNSPLPSLLGATAKTPFWLRVDSSYESSHPLPQAENPKKIVPPSSKRALRCTHPEDSVRTPLTDCELSAGVTCAVTGADLIRLPVLISIAFNRKLLPLPVPCSVTTYMVLLTGSITGVEL